MKKDKKLTKKVIYKILDWCVVNYGRSEFNKNKLIVDFRKPDYLTGDVMASYDYETGIIYVNKETHKTLRMLINSIIHEYTHYKQNMRHYNILDTYLAYNKNPLEIEAFKIAKRDTKRCIDEIKDSLK